MAKDGIIRFLCSCEWSKTLAKLPAEVRVRVYDAMFTFAATGEYEPLEPLGEVAFEPFKNEIARYLSHYEQACEAKRKNIEKRWANTANTNVYKSIQKYTNVSNNNNNNNIEENKIKENIKEKKNKEELPSAQDGADGVSPPPPTRIQKKEKKKKEPFVIPDDASEKYRLFINWLKEYTPHFFNSCEHIITQEEMEKLIARYDKKTFFHILLSIENRRDKRGTYSNMYFTALNWLKSEYARRENNKQQAWW